MAMGLPVISTNWSGLTAFLNERTGYPIEVEEIVVVRSLPLRQPSGLVIG